MSKKKTKVITVGFVALGCPKNIVDSEKMLAEIVGNGLLLTGDVDNADAVVINTCGFIAPAKDEAIEAIREAVNNKRKGNVKKVIVTGCLAERMGDELLSEVDGIDAVIGLASRDSIAKIIRKTFSASKPKAWLEQSGSNVTNDRARLLITPGHWAYLRISEGCDHRCAFCTIPAIRGRFRSKPPEEIIAEANELVSAGTVELNIIAQDTAYYGRDLKMKDGLANLLKQLEGIEKLKWTRLMYLYPVGITEQLIKTISSSEKIVPYFDIPIQHINDTILKKMRRPDTKKRICELIEKLRKTIPGTVLRSTVIVGLPGETDEQFAELLDFVNSTKFDALGAFKYYPEQGTEAVEMDNQVPEEVKQSRLERLMLAQQKIAFEKNKTRIGSELLCLIDSVDSTGNGQGRFYGQAPEIDSICLIENCSAKTGEFVDTKVIGSKEYDLIVEQI
ncbi:30S ribosomal protein S12 methylthiotransferase RimO [Planctomycetota bacterium]